ncbi:MAG TPA: hypothetical protein VN605_11970, partial [Thermoanaerobaculia bacterium]|nr:hypothetical protein [Thermoanaerobaculia bacterium]
MKAFNRTNCDISKTGTRVERIFLQFDPKGCSPGEQAVLDAHLAAQRNGGNIAAYVIRPSLAARLVANYGLPSGFGFTFISDSAAPAVVLLHWGFAETN